MARPDFKILFETSPLAFAVHEMVFDDNQVGVDYRFLSVNPAFEKVTELKKEVIINKSVKEVLPDIVNDPFDWITFYSDVVLKNEKKSFTQYSRVLKRWYKVDAFKINEQQFATIFMDVTDEKLHEELLLDDKTNLEGIIYHLPGVVYRTVPDKQLALSFLSDAIYDLLGYKKEEFLKDVKALEHAVHAEDKRLAMEKINTAIRLKKPWVIEYRMIHKNQESVWVHERGRAIYREDGTVDYLDGIIIGIEDPSFKDNRLSLAAQYAESFIHQAFESSMDGIGIYTESGNIKDCNEGFITITGYTKKELTSQSYTVLKHEEDVELSRERIKRAIKDGAHRYETRWVQKSGNEIDVEISMSFNALKKEVLIFVRDITKLKIQERELEYLKNTLDRLDAFVYMKDMDSKYYYANKKMLEYFNESLDSLKLKSDYDLFTVETAKVIKEIDLKVLKGDFTKEEVINYDKDGEMTYFNEMKAPIYDGNTEPVGILGISTDITKEKKLEEAVRMLSLKDPLTDLYNRRYYIERLDTDIKRFKRKGELFSVAILDIDYFKAINDDFGHLVGDVALKHFSEEMRNAFRSSDLIARFGGEEFIITFYDSEKEAIKRLLDRFREQFVKKGMVVKGKQLSFSFSAGVVDTKEYINASITKESLIATADRRMYKAKNAGRNQTMICD